MKIIPAIFEEREIRRLYDEKTQIWFFSVVDIIQVLTQQPDYKTAQNYWKVLKHRLNKEGSQVVTNCNQLKLSAADGKNYLTDVANVETLLRLVQSVPSPKAEPFKLWLAKVGHERMQEMPDPAPALHGWRRETITNVVDLVARLKNFRDQVRWVFRGECCGYDDCKPGISRGVHPVSLEGELSAVASHPAHSQAELDVVMMVAQHYDIPTRLIDWSLDPLVAMYFASAECTVSADSTADPRIARIWCYDWVGAFPSLADQWDRDPLAEHVTRKSNLHVNLSDLIRKGVTGWIVMMHFEPPIGRLRDQRAVATVAGDPTACHLEALAVLDRDGIDHRVVLEFPALLKSELRKICDESGVNDKSLGLTNSARPSIPSGPSTTTAVSFITNSN
ncbi:MAG: FRG domain-containing protein [Phycisphaerales bacterium]